MKEYVKIKFKGFFGETLTGEFLSEDSNSITLRISKALAFGLQDFKDITYFKNNLQSIERNV